MFIDRGAANPTITIRANQSVRSLLANEALVLSGGTLTLNSDSEVTASFTVTSGTLNGPGTLTNASTLELRSSTINSPLVNQSLLLVRGNSAIDSAAGSFTTNANSIVRVRGDGSFSTGILTVANGFTNNGLIELTDQDGGFGATLNVTNGTLTNAALATIQALAGAAGSRTLNAQLDNQAQGTLTVNQALTINQASADHVNSGTINVALGNLTMSQSGSTPSFTTTGVIDIGMNRTLTITGGNGLFNYDAGTLGGPGTLSLVSTIANFTPSFANATTQLLLSSSTLNGPGTLTNASTLELRSSTINSPLVNQSLLLVRGNSAIDSAAGSFTTNANSIVRVRGDGSFSTGILTVANGFTNNGLIELTDQDGGFGATLNVTNGTLTNAALATIQALAGAGGPRTISAAIINNGTLTLAGAATVLTLNSSYSSSATSRISIIVAGTSAGQFSRINGSGTLTLGGQLFASFQLPYVPVVNDTFAFLTATSVTGNFTAVWPANVGAASTVASATTVTLQLTAATAVTATWLGGSGNWNDPTKWSTGVLPTTGDTAIINSGTVTLPTGTTLQVGHVQLNGGTITGGGTIETLDLVWTGGTFSSGGGTLSILAGGTGAVTGTHNATISGFTLRNAGTFNWSAVDGSGQVQFILSGRFVNEASGTFNLGVDAWFVTPDGRGAGNFDNAGLFRKTAGSGAALFGQAQGITFTNTGTVEILSGSLQLGSSLTSTVTHSGMFSLAAGTTLAVVGGTHSLAGTVTFSGTGPVAVSGGTLLLNAAIDFNATALHLAGGTISGSGASTAANLTWTSGTFTAGGGSLTVTGNGSVTGAHNATVSGFTLRNAGTFNWNAVDGSGQVQFILSGRFVNEASGTFNLGVDAWFVTPDGKGAGNFDNAGLFRKTAGSGAALFDQAQGITFTNTGTVEILSGSLQLGSSLTSTVTHSGMFSLAAGTTLAVVGGTQVFSNVTAVSGAGTLQLAGGALTVSNPLVLTDTTLASAGTITGDLTNSGLLLPDQLNVQGDFTQAASGVVLIEIAGTDTGEFDRLKIDGAAALGGTLRLSFIDGFTPSVGDNFNFLSFATATGNFAAIESQPVGVGATLSATGFTVTVQSVANGAIAWDGGGDGESWHDPLNWNLDRVPGSLDDVTIDVPGLVHVTFANGTTRVRTIESRELLEIVGGTLDINTSATIDRLLLHGGVIDGAFLAVTQLMDWSAGTAGVAQIDLGEAATLHVISGGEKHLDGVLTLAALGVITASDFLIDSEGEFHIGVGAVVEFQSGGSILPGTIQIGLPLPVLNNLGTVRKTGLGESVIGVVFTSGGAVEVQVGTLTLAGAFDPTNEFSGTFTIASGATLKFNGGFHEFLAGSSVGGAGDVVFARGAVFVNGAYNLTGKSIVSGGTASFEALNNIVIARLELNDGSVDFEGSATVVDMTMTGGQVRGAGSATVTGLLKWQGGTMLGTGTFEVAPPLNAADKGLRIEPGTQKLLTRRLVLNGPGQIIGLDFLIGSFGVLTIGLNGELEMVGAADISAQFTVGSDLPLMNNFGVVRKTGAGESLIGVVFNNSFLVGVQAGTLALSGALDPANQHSGSFDISSGATLKFSGGNQVLTNTSSVTGAGDVIFEGGTVTIEGSYDITGKTTIRQEPQ